MADGRVDAQLALRWFTHGTVKYTLFITTTVFMLKFSLLLLWYGFVIMTVYYLWSLWDDIEVTYAIPWLPPMRLSYFAVLGYLKSCRT